MESSKKTMQREMESLGRFEAGVGGGGGYGDSRIIGSGYANGSRFKTCRHLSTGSLGMCSEVRRAHIPAVAVGPKCAVFVYTGRTRTLIDFARVLQLSCKHLLRVLWKDCGNLHNSRLCCWRHGLTTPKPSPF